MPVDRDRLLLLAEAISDGRSIDWAATERAIGDETERELVRQLRLLAGMAGLHRPGGFGPELQAPSGWGGFEIVERVGFGSAGSVYRARDPRSERDVALKLLAADIDPDRASAVIGAGRAMTRIRHRHVVTVFGADRIDGAAGVWMEFVEGRTLDQILRADGPRSPTEAALIGIDLCDARALNPEPGGFASAGAMRAALVGVVLPGSGPVQGRAWPMRLIVIGLALLVLVTSLAIAAR